MIASTISKYEAFLKRLQIIVPTGSKVSGASAAISPAPTSIVYYLIIKGCLADSGSSSAIFARGLSGDDYTFRSFGTDS